MGQERCRAKPKGDLNHAKTRSKIGHRRVLKREVHKDFSFFVPLAEVVVPVAARQTYLHSVDLDIGVQLFCLFYLFKKQVCVGLTN